MTVRHFFGRILLFTVPLEPDCGVHTIALALGSSIATAASLQTIDKKEVAPNFSVRLKPVWRTANHRRPAEFAIRQRKWRSDM